MDRSQRVTHVLDRLGFGPRPGDRQRVTQLGVEDYIEQQLNPGSEEPNSLSRGLGSITHISKSPVAIFNQFSPPRQASEQQRMAARERQVQLVRESERARLLRAIESPHQLREVMVDFWFNHFNVFLHKGLTKLWLGNYEQTAIRPHVLGRFRDLLGATARHPAMLYYLDNWRNTAPPQNGRGGRGLNENYARELMELHTLGVDGGYSQADVENLARILTGWSIVGHQRQSPDGSGFVFVAQQHDSGPKQLLGQRFGGGGVEEGERALDILAGHPSTARHISYKLAQYFVADVPPEGLVDGMARRFQETDGNIRAVLRRLFTSDAFWADAAFQRKFKTPYQYLMSLVRAMEVRSPSDEVLIRLVNSLNQLSMPLFRCQMPDGYSQVESAWLSPDAMMRRVSLAIATVNQQRRLQAESLPSQEILLETLGRQLSGESRRIIAEAPGQQQAALVLGSPEMMYR